MFKPKPISPDHYLIYFIELRRSGKWLTEKYVGHEFTRDPNEALGFSSYEAAEDYLNELVDSSQYMVTGHEFAYIK